MSKARLVITAITLENRPIAEVVATYAISRSWLYELLARYRTEGDAAFEPRSRRPKTSPGATPPETIDLVLRLRKQLADAGHDAGPETLLWHLDHHHDVALSRATIHRILTRHGAVTPEPKKRPKSSYIRFQAAMPNQTWQSDFTHYPLTDTETYPKGIEIITWLDDCTRYALHISAHPRITGDIVTGDLPGNRSPARHPGLHAHRHGLHRSPGRPRPPRRPQRLRTTTPDLERGPEELPTQPPHHQPA